MKLLKSSSIEVPAAEPSFDKWMHRVLTRSEKIQPAWKSGDVHDVRTAIRRCRTMAEALEEVIPDKSWRKVRDESSDLFDAMGVFRDLQVQAELVKKLAPSGDDVRKQLLKELRKQQTIAKSAAAKELANFDRKSWRKLCRRLSHKATFYPLESIVFQRLALARLNEGVAKYQAARKRSSGVAWHRARIALKHFRYLVENFLPQRYEVWSKDLKKYQDVLGDVHDLDVLRDLLRRQRKHVSAESLRCWNEKIAAQRAPLIEEVIEFASGPGSPWLAWRSAFGWGSVRKAAPVAQRRIA